MSNQDPAFRLVGSLKIVHAISPDSSQDTLWTNEVSTMDIIMMSDFKGF